MRRVPREEFVPEAARAHAYDDAALLLGHGQTVSQPFIVALICQSLELTGSERVLDVGTGSGYQAAILAELAASVVSIERIPELAEQARANLAGTAVELRVGNGWDGVPDRAPFDGIAVAAAASEPPQPLIEQLASGGRLVLPVGGRYDQVLVLVERRAAGLRTTELAPVRFVPLVR